MRMPGRPKALNQVVSLPVGSILPSPHQPRRDFNLEELDTFRSGLLAYVEQEAPDLCRRIDQMGQLSQEDREEILALARQFPEDGKRGG